MHDRGLTDHDLLGIGATVRAHRNDVSDDRVADGQAADGAVSELVDDACNIHAGYVGRGPVRQLGCSSSGPESDVGGVHRHRVHSYPHFAGPGLWLG